jgi:hypothetical protein
MLKRTSLLFILFGVLAFAMPSCSGDSRTDEPENPEGSHNHDGHNHEEGEHHEGDDHSH